MDAVALICTKQALLMKPQSEWLIAGVLRLRIVPFEYVEAL